MSRGMGSWATPLLLSAAGGAFLILVSTAPAPSSPASVPAPTATPHLVDKAGKDWLIPPGCTAQMFTVPKPEGGGDLHMVAVVCPHETPNPMRGKQ